MTADTSKQEFTIVSSACQNGFNYYLTIALTLSDNSIFADNVRYSFRCRSTPLIEVHDLPATITNASYSFYFKYSQAENDNLVSYHLRLLDDSFVEAYSSGNLNKVISSGSQFNIPVHGLETNKKYYLVVEGITENNVLYALGKDYTITFTVQYDAFSLSRNIFSVKNLKERGGIKLDINIVEQVGYLKDDVVPTFINGELLDLNKYNDILIYDTRYMENFVLPDNFILKLKGIAIQNNTQILKYGNITVYYRNQIINNNTTAKTFLELHAIDNHNLCKSIILSNSILPPSATDKLVFLIRYQYGGFHLKIINLGK